MRTGLTKKQVVDVLTCCSHYYDNSDDPGSVCQDCLYAGECGREDGFVFAPVKVFYDAIDILDTNYALPEILYRRIRTILLRAIKGKEIDPAEAKEVLGWIMRLKKEAENK